MNELPLLNVLRARVELKEETEESDRESEVLAKSVAEKNRGRSTSRKYGTQRRASVKKRDSGRSKLAPQRVTCQRTSATTMVRRVCILPVSLVLLYDSDD